MEVLEPGPDHGCIARHRQGNSEEIAYTPARRDQLGLQRPGLADARECVSRALVAIVGRGANDHGVIPEAHPEAEQVAGCTIRGGERVFFGPLHRAGIDVQCRWRTTVEIAPRQDLSEEVASGTIAR